MPPRRKDALLELLSQTAEDRDLPWHASLLGALDGVGPDQARWRPAPDRNSIWDLVRHVTHWKRALMSAWDEDGTDHDAWSQGDWAALPEADTAWADDVEALARTTRLLSSRLAAADERLLDLEVAGFRGSTARNAMQVATHDAYHAGQIRLLLRLQGAS